VDGADTEETMEQADEILRLLAEIRDLQREHLAEYRRISAEVIRMNKASSEKAIAQYTANLKIWKAMTWGIFILIAVCVAANLFMLLHMAGGR
jgi:hypothetical protein